MNSGDFIVYVLVGDPATGNKIQTAASLGGLSPVMLSSAGEYLRKPESSSPVCLILGMELPDMSGAQLQERLANAGAAIVFVSERVDVAHSVRAIKAGAVDYLTTPIDPAVLVGAVQNAIEVDRFRKAERARLSALVRRCQSLTARERQIFPLVTAGLLNKQVASVMGISVITVQIHRSRIMQKMEARTFAELVRFADALGISCELTEDVANDRQFVSPIHGREALRTVNVSAVGSRARTSQANLEQAETSRLNLLGLSPQ